MTQRGEFDTGPMVRALQNAGEAVKDALRQGLRDAGEYILGEAVAIVPHDTGALSQSGKVTVDDEKFRATVSFDTPYAVKQHEIPYYHEPPRQWKYLETPLNGSAEQVQALLKARLDGV